MDAVLSKAMSEHETKIKKRVDNLLETDPKAA